MKGCTKDRWTVYYNTQPKETLRELLTFSGSLSLLSGYLPLCELSTVIKADAKLERLHRCHFVRSRLPVGIYSNHTMCEIWKTHGRAGYCRDSSCMTPRVTWSENLNTWSNQYLKRSGGSIDCTLDFNFHSKRGKYRGQALQVSVPTETRSLVKHWWMFWA
jgi:hypothetical protein